MFSKFKRFSLVPRLIATIVTTALAVSAFLPAASAQEGLDEIVVTTTARGRAEQVQDVPASVTVISGEEIDKYGIERVEDFVALTPGVTIVNAAEVADTQVNIRGINGSRDAENSYALIIDGVLMTNPAALNREYTNLEQIEVLKGPQGALYGRNAAAGAIILNTAEPGDELGGGVKASVAQDDSYLVAGHVGGGLSDGLRWQLTGDYRDSDGFYANRYASISQATTGESVDEDAIDNFENWNITGRLIWEPSDATKIDTKLRYGEVDAASITFNSVFHIPELAAAFGVPSIAEDVNDHPFGFNPNINSFNNQEALEFSIRGEHDLGFADLVGYFLYSDIDNNLGADGTSGAFGFFWTDPRCIATTTSVANSGFALNPPQFLVPGDPASSFYGAYTPTSCDGTQYQERNQEDYSFELRLRSKDDQRLRWEAGVYYLNIEREVGVNLGVDDGTGITESLFVPVGQSNPTEQLAHDQFDSDVYAVFGQLAWDLTDDIEIAGALRYDKEERDVENLVPTGATTQFLVCTFGDPFTGGDPINAGLCNDPTGASGDKSEDFDQWQPKVTATWDIIDNLTAYASVGVGFKSGGFNNFGSAATVNDFINTPFVAPTAFPEVGISDDFKEETSTSYEVGFKSRMGPRLAWEASYYHVDVDDMQFFEFFVGQFGLLRVVSNIDEVSIDGFEATVNWSVLEWLDVYANGNIISSEIDANSSRPDSVGNDAPYTADYTYAVGANMSFPLTAELDVIANVNVNGLGDTWFHVIQGQERPTIFQGAFGLTNNGEYSIAQRDSFTLVDARLGIAGENWSVVAFGRNIFDEEWLQEVIPAPEFGGSFTHPGSESRFGVEATYSF